MVDGKYIFKTSLIDCHVHSKSSHDSWAEPSDIVRETLKNGFLGAIITDHVDIADEGTECLFPAYDSYRNYCSDVKKVIEAEGAYDGFILNIGAEIGESIRNQKACEKLIKELPLDSVMGSVHKIYIDGRDFVFSDYKFPELPEDFVRRVVVQYYKDVLETAKTSDIDILCHLNLINRYELKFFKQDIFDDELGEIIREILAVIIRRNIALEINGSRYSYGAYMPGPELLKIYKSMGGKLITYGSDAHTAETVGQGFDGARKMLLELGFDKLYYYSGRKPVAYDI